MTRAVTITRLLSARVNRGLNYSPVPPPVSPAVPRHGGASPAEGKRRTRIAPPAAGRAGRPSCEGSGPLCSSKAKAKQVLGRTRPALCVCVCVSVPPVYTPPPHPLTHPPGCPSLCFKGFPTPTRHRLCSGCCTPAK